MSRKQARIWTALDDQVLRALHSGGHGVSYIAKFMVSCKKSIHRRARELGLAFDETHRWTPAENAILRARYPDEPTADLARELGLPVGKVHARAKKLGLYKSDVFRASDKAGRIQRGRTDPRFSAGQFKKGHAPANKGLRRPGWSVGRMAETQFKKGRPASESRNYVPIGTEKVDPKRRVLMRKVTDDPSIFPVKRWRPVHVMVWEGVHGAVPFGHIVIFKPGQKTYVAAEITIDRLELVSLAENMRRNTVHNLPKDLARVVQLRGALVRQIRRREKQHGND
ncbi:HNH endonuclease [Dyella sp. 2RAB6]|uniref:HNH endonuclease n=1 Tax=Dyella sp. 2RAB6 TaxID=3232992 RepID=UPI003F8DCC73